MPTCRPRKVHHKNFNLNPRNLAKKTHTRKHTSLVISEYIYIYILHVKDVASIYNLLEKSFWCWKKILKRHGLAKNFSFGLKLETSILHLWMDNWHFFGA
jgi:hypothetical protein